MDYQRIYDEFIADRRSKEADLIASGEYKERHHIVPRSMGGADDASNLVALTAGDHYFAHLLLGQIHGGKMWGGVEAMANMRGSSKRRDNFSARYMVSVARKKAAAVHSVNAKAMHAEGKLANAQSPKAQEKRSKTMTGKNQDWAEARIEGIKAAAKRGAYSAGAKKKWAKMSDEAKAGYSERMTERNYNNNPAQTEAGRAKIKAYHNRGDVKAAKSLRATGANNPMARAVMCIETGETFQTAVAAGLAKGIKSHGNINKVCAGKVKKAGGYRWAYA